jgi:hypothetical protein
MSNDEKDDTQAPHSESPLKGEEKSASEPPSESHTEKGPGSQDFPEGGRAGWGTAIGACVQMSISLVTTFDVPNDF